MMNNPLLQMDGLPLFSKIKPEHAEAAIDVLLLLRYPNKLHPCNDALLYLLYPYNRIDSVPLILKLASKACGYRA